MGRLTQEQSMSKLSERQIEVLTKGATAKGYKRVHDRGEGNCLYWLAAQGRIEEVPASDAEVYRTTDKGKAALKEAKAKKAGART
jgi:hypothetical protein